MKFELYHNMVIKDLVPDCFTFLKDKTVLGKIEHHNVIYYFIETYRGILKMPLYNLSYKPFTETHNKSFNYLDQEGTEEFNRLKLQKFLEDNQ